MGEKERRGEMHASVYTIARIYREKSRIRDKLSRDPSTGVAYLVNLWKFR